ncbi:hypothetical protein AB0D91_40180 [Streptomyces canus]
MTSTPDCDQAVARLVGLVMPRLAEWAVVDLITESDGIRRTRRRSGS